MFFELFREYFLWILLKNSWFSLKNGQRFHWFSLIFNEFIMTFHWFSLNFNQGVVQELIWILSQKLARFSLNFIENGWILLSNLVQNWFSKWEKYFIQFLWFYYQLFIDWTLIHYFKCGPLLVHFGWDLLNFIIKFD